MTVEAGDALSGQDGTAAVASPDGVVPTAPGEGPPATPPAAPQSTAPATGTTAGTTTQPAAPTTGPDSGPEAGPKSSEIAGPTAPTEGDPAAAPAHAPAWLSGRPTLPWPPPGAVGPTARAAAAIPAPRRPAVTGRPERVPGPPPMPRIAEDPAILGLSRLTRGRFGSRVFTWFFVFVFTLIAAQMVTSILYPW